VEIHSESYEIRTNAAEFVSQVILIEHWGGKPRTTLNCGHMVASFTGSNQVQRMLAEQDVVIAQDEKRFTADSAAFTGTNQVLALNGNPTWRDGDRAGRGDSILLEGLHGELAVRGNATLRLPASQIGPAEIGSVAPVPKPTAPAPTNQFAEISSRDYTLKTNSALFEGGVQVVHPQMKLLCKTLSLDAKPSGEARNLVAQDSVIFDLEGGDDQKIHGTGKKAVYTYSMSGNKTNDMVEFTGDPMLTMPDGTIFKNKVIIFDRANGKVTASGKYFIHGIGSSSATNEIEMPKPGVKRKRKGST
jgi:lipopolysaccharide export system protein LptA